MTIILPLHVWLYSTFIYFSCFSYVLLWIYFVLGLFKIHALSYLAYIYVKYPSGVFQLLFGLGCLPPFLVWSTQ